MAEPTAEATLLSEERAEMRDHALLDESMSVLTESVSSSEEHGSASADDDEVEAEEEGGEAAPAPLPGTEAFDAIVNNSLLQFSQQEESRDSSNVQEEAASSGDSANDEEDDDDDDEFHVTKIRKAIVDAARRFGSVVILADLEQAAIILQQQTISPQLVVVSWRDRRKLLWWRYHHLLQDGLVLPDGVNIEEYLASSIHAVQEEQKKLFVEKSQSLLAGEFPGCVEVSGEESSPDTSREEAEEEEVEEDAAKGSVGQVDSSSSPDGSALSTLDHVDVNVDDPLGFTGESFLAANNSSREADSAIAADHDGDTTSYASAKMFEEDYLVRVSSSQSMATTPDRQFTITAHNGGEFFYETGLEVHPVVPNKQHEDCMNVTTCETPMLSVELHSKFTEEEEEDVASEAGQSLTFTPTEQECDGGGIPIVDEHKEQGMLQPLVSTDKDTLALNQETPESLNGTPADGSFLQLLFDKENVGAVCSPVVVMKQTFDENFINAVVTLPECDVPSAAMEEGVEVDDMDWHQHHSDANDKFSVDKQDVVAEVVSPNEETADAQALPGTDEHVKIEHEPVPGSGHVVISELAQELLLRDVDAQTLNESIRFSSVDKDTTPAAAEDGGDEQVQPIAKDEQYLAVAEAELAVKDAHQDQALELPYGGADRDKSDKQTQHGTDTAPRLVDEESQDVPGAFDSTDEHGPPLVKDENKVVVETVESDSDNEIHQIVPKVVVTAVNPFEQLDEGTGQEPQSGLKGEGEATTPQEASTDISDNVEKLDVSEAAVREASQVDLCDNKGQDLVAVPNHTGKSLDETLHVSAEGDAKLEEPVGSTNSSIVSVDIDPTNDLWLGTFSSSMPQVESSSTKDHELVHEAGAAPVTVAANGSILGLPLQDASDFVESETLDVDLKRYSKSTNGAWLGSFRNCIPQVNPNDEFVSERRRPDADFDEISDIDENEKTMLVAAKYGFSDEQIDAFAKLEDEFLMEIVGPSMENSSFRPLVAEKRDSPDTDHMPNQPNTSTAQRVALADLLLLEDTDGPSEGDKQTAEEAVVPPPGHAGNTQHRPAGSPTPDQKKQEEVGSPGSAFEKKCILLPTPEADGDAAKHELPFLELKEEAPAEVGVANLPYTPLTKVADGKVDPQPSLPKEQVGPAYGQGISIQTVSENMLIDFNEKLCSSSQQLLHAEFLNLCCVSASEPITDDDDDDDIKQTPASIQATQKPVNEDKTASGPSSPSESTHSEEKACDIPKRACEDNVPDDELETDKTGKVGEPPMTADSVASVLDKGEIIETPIDAIAGAGTDPSTGTDVDKRDEPVGEPPMELAADNIARVLGADEIVEPADAIAGAGTDPSTETDVGKSEVPVADTEDRGEKTIEMPTTEVSNDTQVHSVTLSIMEGEEHSQKVAEKSIQMEKAGSEPSDEKRFILKPTTGDSHHTPVDQLTLEALDTVKQGPALQQDESANEASLPCATKNAEKPGDSKARITKQYTQSLFQHPLPSDVVIVPSLASTDSDVTSASDDGPGRVQGSIAQASKKRGVMVDYKNNKYRGFVVVLHERHGVMLMHSSGIKRDEASQHWQLPGGQVHECEFIEAARYTNDKRSQIALAAKACAARELFDQTGLDFRFKLGRLVPASLRPQTSNQNKRPVNELKHRYFFVLRFKDDEFPSQDNLPTDSLDNDLMLTLSTQHSEFTFQSEPSEASNMVKLQSDGKCAEALNIVMSPSKQDTLGKAIVPLQPDQNDNGMVEAISDFLAKACGGFCF